MFLIQKGFVVKLIQIFKDFKAKVIAKPKLQELVQ